MIFKLTAFLFSIVLATEALANSQTECSAGKGDYLVGTAVSNPKYQASKKYYAGIKLSHTVLEIQSDQDQQTYQLAIDNIYANDFDQNSHSVPASLAEIRTGTRLAICGKYFHNENRQGIHWVHMNCGHRPTPDKPDGFVRIISKEGNESANLEASQQFCRH